mgnify:CR=1 FL=1
MSENIHITPRKDDQSWAVKKEGAPFDLGRFPTQQQAIDLGRQMAMIERVELVIHRRDGRIRDKDSYGPDPFPPRDLRF